VDPRRTVHLLRRGRASQPGDRERVVDPARGPRVVGPRPCRGKTIQPPARHDAYERPQQRAPRQLGVSTVIRDADESTLETAAALIVRFYAEEGFATT